jgi:hypothetical protein
VEELKQIGVQIGIAASVRKALWEKAEIHPLNRNDVFRLNEEQHKALALFGARR